MSEVSQERFLPLPTLDGASFDCDATRFITPCLNGFACYRGARNEIGEWKGRLVGIARSEHDAFRFLEGKLVDLLRRELCSAAVRNA